jgi:NNP family nitrate/nitrite transporter-like MFS transporter
VSLGGLRRAVTSGHWPTLIAAWLHLTVSFMVWVLLAALMVAIGAELNLSPAQQSFLVALPLLTGAALRILAGWACDWWGAKPTGIAVLLFQLVALLWAAMAATSYVELLVVSALLGMGGASFAVAMPLASRSYPPAHQGLILGLVASGNIGTVISLALGPLWESVVGWHGAFGVMAAPLLAVLILFVVLVKDDHAVQPIRPRTGWWESLVDLARQRGLYWLAGIYALTFGGYVGLASFLPLFFHDAYGVGLMVAGSVTATCSLIGSLIRPAGGYLADRWGGLRLLWGLLFVISVSLAAAAQAPSLLWAMVLFVAAVGLMGLGNGVVFQIVAEWYPREIGLASGFVGAAGSLGGFFVPIWFSGIRQLTGTYEAGWLTMTALAAVAALSVSLVGRRHPAMASESAEG